VEYLNSWASFGKVIKFLIFWIISHKNISYGSGWGAPQSQKIKNWGSQKNWPDRAKLSMQFFIFHQILPDPHSEPNACFGLLDREMVPKHSFIGPFKLFFLYWVAKRAFKRLWAFFYKGKRAFKCLFVKIKKLL
jgi:hypothetical protein